VVSRSDLGLGVIAVLERLAFGGAWKVDGGLATPAPWIVTEADGAVVNPDTLLRRWKALVRKAGVTPIGLHGARHTHAELSFKPVPVSTSCLVS
jgi:integrase